MNFSSIFGVCAAVFIVIWSIMDSTQNQKIFLNAHAAIMVVGGTLAAALIAFPVSTIVDMLKVFMKKVLGKKKSFYQDLIDEIVDLSKAHRSKPNGLKEKLSGIQNHFLKEAIEITIQGGLEPEQIDQILKKRAKTHFQRYQEEANIFKALSKLPPAFGLLGAVLGMISLMESLGGADAFKKIGPAMAIAMVATFYGIAFANFVLIPIGESLSKSARQDIVERQIVMDGIQMIRKKAHHLIIEEELKSYLLPKERRQTLRAS